MRQSCQVQRIITIFKVGTCEMLQQICSPLNSVDVRVTCLQMGTIRGPYHATSSWQGINNIRISMTLPRILFTWPRPLHLYALYPLFSPLAISCQVSTGKGNFSYSSWSNFKLYLLRSMMMMLTTSFIGIGQKLSTQPMSKVFLWKSTYINFLVAVAKIV